jgi:hypothetical protein
MALTDKLSAIGEAIRAKTGKSDKLTLDQMPGEIAGITGGGSGDVTLLEGLSFELDFSNGDMPFAAPNGYAVKSAIVKKPDTLIPANIKSGVEVAGITGTLSGGANPDANDPVYYVTFMNGDQKLYVRPVASGDSCADVKAKGWIETPTKESTVESTFTYSGWSATDGGTANTTAVLQNIKADKTVYAAYTASPRTYTITYYDSDGVTVLKTETLAYGTTPTYSPTKTGVSFSGWVPALAEVTGDASYTATWIEKLLFATAAWEDIARVSEAGEAQQHFKLGDTRVVNVNGTDFTFYIAGFDHDDLADGSGKAGITLLSKSPAGPEVEIASYRDVLFINSAVYSTYNGWVSTLDSDLQSVIKSVSKKHVITASRTIGTKADKLWAPCGAEIGKSPYGMITVYGLGTKYSKITSLPGHVWLRDIAYQQGISTNYMVEYNSASPAAAQKTVYGSFLGFCV